MAGRSRKIGSRSASAIAAASSEPRRSFSACGPAKAFCTVTCWSSAKPIRSAIGSVAISSLASSESVKWRRSGMGSIVLTDLLAQRDDDAFRPTDVREPIHVLVLHHIAYELGSVGANASDHCVELLDREHDATDAQHVDRPVHGPDPDRVGRVE